MKKTAVMAMALLVCLGGFSAQASDRTAATSQLMISADHVFWANEEESLAAYGSGNFVLTLNNGYASLQGYMGARVSADKLSLYMLGVTLNDAFGWSAGPSMWLEVNGEKNYFFVQYDYNCPFMSTVHKENPALMGEDPPMPLHTYYVYSEYMYNLPNETGIGFALEAFGNYETKDPEQLAYGPFFQMNRLRLWGFYDVTPQIDGYELWGLRFQINL
ncbi:MAG TPA: hypothetical protein ENN28_02865 [Candidatus Uhrbacteria bacterium]|nr:hypothetical protein [Candidatus Uhrbacteria bacterium]